MRDQHLAKSSRLEQLRGGSNRDRVVVVYEASQNGEMRLLWAGLVAAMSLLSLGLGYLFPQGDDRQFMMLEPMVAFAVFCAVMILKNYTFVTAAVGLMVSIIVAASNPSVRQTLTQVVSNLH